MKEVISKVDSSIYSTKVNKYSEHIPDLKHHLYVYYWYKLSKEHKTKNQINIHGDIRYIGTPDNISLGKRTGMSSQDIIDFSGRNIEVNDIKADIIICNSIDAEYIKADILDVKSGKINCDNLNVTHEI